MIDLTPPILTSVVSPFLLRGSCGGGGGIGLGPRADQSSSPNDAYAPTVESGVQSGASPDTRPNFVVSDLLASPETSQSERLSVSATIVNTGQSVVGLPRESWLLVSHSADVFTGYVPFSVRLSTQPDFDSNFTPGGQDTVMVTNTVVGAVDLGLTQYGMHYPRLWVNPELFAYFLNSGETVNPSYASSESDYSDNLSSIVTFENPLSVRPVPPNCTPDALEENGTLSTDVRNSHDTEYSANPCDNWLDIFAVDRNAGQAVKPFLPEGPGDTDWYRSIASASETYLSKKI